MGKPQRAWAKRRRVLLIIHLGGKCRECGCADIASLEIDHIHGRAWKLQKFDPSGRVCRYVREAALGLVQVLCGDCNVRKGGENTCKKKRRTARKANQPF